ncbi:protein TOXD [Penicillium antarcticum]|uniref:protein TOXD n=1 Tax=Penicillium antarcticum TaxID=416450 RepID=UPI0023A6CC8B|nr:protein TOXD [Penicillium antarcticum]KAJ5306165.1 protein TOXD [Penicillium antarcticum]
MSLQRASHHCLLAKACGTVLVGYDYAGIAAEVGKAMKKPFKKGDCICGFAQESDATQPEYETFTEYIVVKGGLLYLHLQFQSQSGHPS